MILGLLFWILVLISDVIVYVFVWCFRVAFSCGVFVWRFRVELSYGVFVYYYSRMVLSTMCVSVGKGGFSKAVPPLVRGIIPPNPAGDVLSSRFWCVFRVRFWTGLLGLFGLHFGTFWRPNPCFSGL